MSTMSFEKYEGSNRGKSDISQPDVKLWAEGKLAFNDVAVDEWLDDATHVELFINDDANQVGVAPTTEGDPGAYTLHTYGRYQGKLLYVKALLKELHATRPDSATTMEAWYDDEHEMVIVDFDPLT